MSSPQPHIVKAVDIPASDSVNSDAVDRLHQRYKTGNGIAAQSMGELFAQLKRFAKQLDQYESRLAKLENR
jgi:hypothetical protein